MTWIMGRLGSGKKSRELQVIWSREGEWFVFEIRGLGIKVGES